MILLYLVILIINLPFSLSDWNYSQVDDLVLAFNHKDNNDSKTYSNVLETIKDNPRSFNDTLCYLQFQSIFDGVREKEKWALKVIDAWGHIPSPGLFWGRTTDFGLFDECISIAHELEDKDNIFVGQYCLARYPLDMIVSVEIEKQQNGFSDRPSAPSFYSRAVCVPDSCSITTLDSIFKQMFFNETNKHIEVEMFREELCTRNEPIKLADGSMIALAILGVIGILVLLSTSYDIMVDEDQKKSLLISFSIVTNSNKLFKIQNKTKSSESIECINAIRFFSMVWIVFGHLFMILPNMPMMNYKIMWEFIEEKYPMPVMNSAFGVDTFLLLSGFLIVYHTFKVFNKGRTISIGNILWMYIHRYVRLFPMLGITILYTITLFKYTGSGPYWNNLTSSMSSKCERYWWSSLLYVQNYVNPYELCLTHTWYLSLDTQLYFLSPLLVIPLHKWGRKFVCFIILLLIASFSYVFTISMINDSSSRIIETVIAANDKAKATVYYSVPARCGPWLIGILLGYFVHTIKQKESKWRRFGFLLGWICWGILLPVIMLGNHSAQGIDAVQDTVASSFYISLSRIGWAIVVAWIIFACHQGYGGFINSFLSFPIWQCLARLTYAMYLIHPFIQLARIGELRVNIFSSHSTVIRIFWGDFGIIVTFAIILILLFESPIIALEKNLLGGNRMKENINGNNTQTMPELKDDQKLEAFN